MSSASPNFNLIVSTYAMREENAIEELKQYISGVYVVKKQRSLLILKLTRVDPYKAIDIIRENIDPRFTNILKVIPVDRVEEAIVQRVAETVWSMVDERIAPNETYRITLDGRLYWLRENGLLEKAHSRDTIDYIAGKINRKVNLTNPDKVVYIKTVKVGYGDYAAIAICEPKYILSTQKLLHKLQRELE
ncbi:MAG TPA: hypothetical protein EYH40_02580 [Desulfurococcales archaeon]|nr:hypothetical protein [Desulfurococcales archaeon]